MMEAREAPLTEAPARVCVDRKSSARAPMRSGGSPIALVRTIAEIFTAARLTRPRSGAHPPTPPAAMRPAPPRPLVCIFPVHAIPLRLVTGLLLAGFAARPPAHAHGDLHLQLQQVTEEITAAPSAALYLKRGGLHHAHEEYAAALADYERAGQLDPALVTLAYARAGTLFKAGQPAAALDAIDAFLRRQPGHADARLLRARVLYAQKHYTAAAAEFDRSFALVSEPRPECVLERAEALVAAGQPQAALDGLDAALRRRGNLVTFQHAAIALELKLGRPDAALARVDRVLADLSRKETWLARRGEILEAAGRPAEARRTFAEALQSIERLPAPHRDTPFIRDLAARLRLKLGS